MSYVVEAQFAINPKLVGGKAASLGRLAAAGFAPPDFFAVRADAFQRGIIRADASEEIVHALAKLGPGPFAVRSSGRSEDGESDSHAGQFLSVLNVEADGVLSAAAEVWQSGFTDSIAEYRRSRGLQGTGEAPAIIVQQMVDARAAGVAFSADPVTGLHTWVLISAVEGLGDALVSGTADGEDFRVDKASGTIVDGPTTPTALTFKDVASIADLAIRVETAFGGAQDIEWAFAGDRLYILQARPITTPLLRQPQPDANRTIFDNSNIVESYPGLVTPLTYSFARYAYARVYLAFVRLAGVPESVIRENGFVFENLLGRIDGRVYYNLVNWYRALAMLPGFSLNRAHMETMMGVSEPLSEDITEAIGPKPATGLKRLVEYGRVVRVGLVLVWQAIRLPKTIRAFNERLENNLTNDPLDLNTASLSALAKEYRRIEADLLDRWDAPLVNDFLCMMAFGASRKLLEKYLGQAGPALHNDIMIGQGDIISAEPARRIAALGQRVALIPGLTDDLRSNSMAALEPYPDLRKDISSYIDKFGDRCVEELKLESIPLDQDPTPLTLAIAGAAGRPESASEDKAAPSGHKKDPFGTHFRGKPIAGFVSRKVVGWAKARVRDRENLRFERTRIFGRARKVFLAIGRELQAYGFVDHERDVFYLTVEEVLGAIEGYGMSRDLRTLAGVRRAEQEAAQLKPDPPERITVYGAAINALTAVPTEQMQILGDEETQQGIGCSAGLVEAAARVVHDPSKETLDPGNVLVARHTDPGWISVFCNASAIVVERGSLLSHSAIVARELGIPCVVGLKGATRWIKDGDRIAVDGASGTVRRIDG